MKTLKTLQRTLALALLACCTAPAAWANHIIDPDRQGERHFADSNAATRWVEHTLDVVRAEGTGTGDAGRLYAMTFSAIYDAVNGIDRARGLSSRGHAIVPPAGAPLLGDRSVAAAAAAHAILIEAAGDREALDAALEDEIDRRGGPHRPHLPGHPLRVQQPRGPPGGPADRRGDRRQPPAARRLGGCVPAVVTAAASASVRERCIDGGTGGPWRAVSEPITSLLRALRDGDRSALDRLAPLVYDRLRRMARARMRGERAGHTLDTTSLVHEAYLELVAVDRADWRDRGHFFAVAARVMRNVLVDHAERRRAVKRGGGARPVTLDPDLPALVPAGAEEILALNAALERLRALDPRQERVVECRFFAGMTVEETAAALGVAPATVKRDWESARAWLNRELAG